MRMQTKIFSTFLIVIAIPTVIFLAIILEISTSMIEKRTKSASELVVKESVKRIDTLLNNYRQASMQIYYNQNIIDHLEDVVLRDEPLEQKLPLIEDILGSIVNADRYLMSAVLRVGDEIIVRGTRTLNISEYLGANIDGCRINPGQLSWIPSEKMQAVFGLDSFYFGAMRLVRKNDRELGELLFLIREDFFDDIYAGAIPENSGNDLVVAPDGTIVSSLNEALIGLNIADSRFGGILSGAEGSGGSVFSLRDGEESYLIFSRSEESGWYFIRELEERAVLQGIIELRRSLIGIIILFLSFLVFLSYLFSRELSRPVNTLAGYIDGIGPNNLGVPPPEKKSGGDEISRLHERLYAMSSRIEVLINEVSQKERLKTQAELKALRNHISPHFIYNALDTIRWMAVINKQDNIRKMVSALDNLMRYAADYEKILISLSDELELTREYIVIQKMRYSDIELETDIPDGLGDLLVNKFIIQTIVENCIVHGFRDFDSTGHIRITAASMDDVLKIVIRDDGAGFDPAEIKADSQTHTGLSSVDQRLKLNYGEEYGIAVNSSPGSGTEVELSLPVSEKGNG